MQTNMQTRLMVQSYVIEKLTSDWTQEDKTILFEESFDTVIQKDFLAKRYPKINPTITKQ